MTPRDLGTFFDVLTERGSRTRVTLSRPLDIAPDGGVRYDVPALAALVRDAAGWLHALGARPGERVAIMKDNHWDYALLAIAAARIGAVPALLSPIWTPTSSRSCSSGWSLPCWSPTAPPWRGHGTRGPG